MGLNYTKCSSWEKSFLGLKFGRLTCLVPPPPSLCVCDMQTDCMVDVTAEIGHTPLHAAILKNHSRLVELLIGYGADPTIADEGGSTPLYFALDNEDLDAPSEDTPELNKVSLT